MKGEENVRIEKKKIDELIPAEYNPRVDLQPGDTEYEKLKRSILEFDLVEPLVWNERTGRLVGGHQRLKVLKELGYEEVEVSIVDLDEEREKALNIALNKVQGDWDKTKLKDLLEELDTGAFDMELTGFDYDELEKLMTESADISKEKEIPEMELKSFEHYDYIVLVFRNVHDWLNAQQLFGIEKVNGSFTPKNKKIGLGRVVDGEKLFELIGHKDTDIEQGQE